MPFTTEPIPQSKGFEIGLVAEPVPGQLVVLAIFIGGRIKRRRHDQVDQERLDPIMLLLV